MNGLAEQPGPDGADPIHYPFKSYDGRMSVVAFASRSVAGSRRALRAAISASGLA